MRALILAVALLVGAVSAAQADNSQQEKMKQCNTQASDKKLSGDERKSFMSSCLSASGSSAATSSLTPQQQKMKTCNATASHKALKGDERQAFMKSCLSGS
jgi:hypothetical protein